MTQKSPTIALQSLTIPQTNLANKYGAIYSMLLTTKGKRLIWEVEYWESHNLFVRALVKDILPTNGASHGENR